MISLSGGERSGVDAAAAGRADVAGEGCGPGPVSFVSDFRYLECPFSLLEHVLADPAAGWLRRLSAISGPVEPELLVPPPTGARERTPAALVRVGLGPAHARFTVLVSLGPPRRHAGEVLVPLGWEPLQLERLLPSLDGDLALTDAEGGSCRLGLTGRYRAPLAGVGKGLDRLALHGLAESSVRNFLAEAEAALLACAGRSEPRRAVAGDEPLGATDRAGDVTR